SDAAQLGAALAVSAGAFAVAHREHAWGGVMSEQPATTGHIYSRKDFTWREHPDGWALHAIGHESAIVHVVSDATYPGMWRIRHSGGQLSDMASLTSARMARWRWRCACSIPAGRLNKVRRERRPCARWVRPLLP